MRQLPVLWAAFCAAAMLCDHCAKAAEIILDDFVDSAELTSPEMDNWLIATENVGALKATRNIELYSLQGDPDGFLDSNLSTPSLLTGQIRNLNPRPRGSTMAGIQLDYVFPHTDFSPEGKNNAVFIDFAKLTSEIPPSLLIINLDDGSRNRLFIETQLPRNPSPLTLAVPFDSFTFRGGDPADLDLTSMVRLNLEIRASELAGGGPDPLNFFVEIDRIRVGRIPEPPTLACGLISTIVGCGVVYRLNVNRW